MNQLGKTWGRVFGLSAALFMLMSGMGCGNGYKMSSTNPSPIPTMAAQFKLGDAPADRVVSLEVTIGPVSLTAVDGSTVTILSSAQRLEITHLAGTSVPLGMLNLPTGSFSGASMTVKDPEITFVNSSGVLVKFEPAFNATLPITFTPPLSLTGGSQVVSVDMNVAKSLIFDAQGNVTGLNINPASFTFTAATPGNGDDQEAEDGGLEDTTGTVTAVSGNSFTLQIGTGGASLTFATDSKTEFKDGSTLANILNAVVKVEGVTNSDGSLYAKEVEGVEDENGGELEGTITQVTGSPKTLVTVIGDDGAGSGMDAAKLGAKITFDVSNANFEVHQGGIDTSGIGGLPSSPNFPFDANTIHAGQRIAAESRGSVASGTSADKVRLEQQAVTGTVSGLSQTTSSGPTQFVLTLPSDSAFAKLAGTTTITVYWQPGTDLRHLNSVSNGDTVRVRGLVFYTGSVFNIIARRIDP
jgi:hypothetical protein